MGLWPRVEGTSGSMTGERPRYEFAEALHVTDPETSVRLYRGKDRIVPGDVLEAGDVIHVRIDGPNPPVPMGVVVFWTAK